MDAAARERALRALARWVETDEPCAVIAGNDLGALIRGLTATEEQVRELQGALYVLANATEHLQFAIREGFEDHEWFEEIAGNLLDDAMLEGDEALEWVDEVTAAMRKEEA